MAVAKVAGGGAPLGGGGSTSQAGPKADLGVSAALAVSGPVPGGGTPAATPGPPPGLPAGQPTPAPVSSPAPVAAPAPAATPVPGPVAAESEPVVADLPGATVERGGSGASIPPRTAVGGPGLSATSFEIHDGGQYELSFKVTVESPAYMDAGLENLLLRFGGEEGEPPALGLQLWQLGGDRWYGGIVRGLWASGEAAGGERFLASLSEGVWHSLAVDFAASDRGEGSYAIFLDGGLIDARSGVSLIVPDRTTGTVELGLFREGRRLEGSSGLRVAEAGISETSPASAPLAGGTTAILP